MRLITAILAIVFVIWTAPVMMAGLFMFIKWHDLY